METVTSMDGTKIAFERSGAGPPLVLVHGTAGDRRDWAAVAPMLAERFTVWAMDRRGHGDSEDGAGYAMEREFQDVASVVAAVVEAAGGPVHLLGHSFGAVCAMEAALRLEELETLLLYEPVVPEEVGGLVELETIDRIEQRLAEEDRDGALRVFLQEVARLEESEIGAMEGAPAWTAALETVHTVPREIRALNGYRFKADRFRDVAARTRVLVGEASPRFLRRGSQAVAGAFADGQTVTLDGVGHLAMFTRPNDFAALVIGLLD